MRRTAFWLALTAVGATVSTGAYLFVHQGLPLLGVPPLAGPSSIGSAGTVEAAVLPARKAVAVEAAPVRVATIVDDIRAVGSLMPNEAVALSPEIAGRVARIRFTEGTTVEAGQVLVDLDSDILRAELDKARSALTFAKANYERAETLTRQRTGTQRALDEATAVYQAERANVALAEARLERATVVAPFAGVAGLRRISVGAYVMPGDVLVDIADIDPIKVDFRVPELSLPHLRVGLPVHVAVDALPSLEFTGEVYAIDPVVDANGRAIRLRARIANPDGVLTPGLFARVRIVVERRENALVVPESAIISEGERYFVFRVVNGKAVRTPVVLGLRRPGSVEIGEGLSTGDMLVTSGQQRLRDGTAVDLLPGADAAPAPNPAT